MTYLFIQPFYSCISNIAQQTGNHYWASSINYRGTSYPANYLPPHTATIISYIAPAQVSAATMATGPNLHCQAQFTVTLPTRPVVKVSAHTPGLTLRKRQLPFRVRDQRCDNVPDESVCLFHFVLLLFLSVLQV